MLRRLVVLTQTSEKNLYPTCQMLLSLLLEKQRNDFGSRYRAEFCEKAVCAFTQKVPQTKLAYSWRWGTEVLHSRGLISHQSLSTFPVGALCL